MTIPLTATDLFYPVPSGVGTNPNLEPDAGTWLGVLLQIATAVGLPTTSWQPGGPERTLLSVLAVSLSQEDALVSLMAQGGFLDFAASGTVTYVDTEGNTITAFVTPDPSLPSQNPKATPGWLDLLADSVYDVQRPQATYASGQVAIVNTTASQIGPFAPGTYHVANSVTNYSYSNTGTQTVPSSQIAGTGGVITGVVVGTTTVITTQTAHGLVAGDVVYVTGVNGVSSLNGTFTQAAAVTSTTISLLRTTTGSWTSGGTVYHATQVSFQADVIGPLSNAAPGAITTIVTLSNGIFSYNITALSASNYMNNTDLAALCRLKLGTLSPNGPSQAYEYFALTSQTILAAETPPILLTNGAIAKAIAVGNPQNGTVVLTVASSSPYDGLLGGHVTPGCSQLGIFDASNTTPIVITTLTPHFMESSFTATITGVVGNTSANGFWTVTRLSSTTFSLDTSIGNGVYDPGTGSIEGGDLGNVDIVIHENVVPDAIIAYTESALSLPVTVSANVIVPKAQASAYVVSVQNLLTLYFAALPIGGIDGIVPYDAVVSVLFEAGILTIGGLSYVRDVTDATVNGLAVDVSYPTDQYVAILGTITINVVPV